MRGVERIPWLYDLGMALTERWGLLRWRRWLAAGAAGRTLDLGTGTGRNLPLVPPGARPVGVDAHLDSLLRARRRAPGVPLVAARAEALPFRDGAFETVLSGLVLCSVDDPAAALAEVRRVLAPRGALRLLEHVRARGLRGAVQDAIQPAWTWFTGGCHPNRETERAVEAAGFRADAATRRARGTMRRLEATVRADAAGEAPAGAPRAR
ncbi:MAG TPA: class I SAM-dependent methyltransferase [Anaeromyxobacter sp.]|nr:class I SAM-dependent methyltransferase [Anaeromyxobacter sp.]